jgi:hypothetical protein
MKTLKNSLFATVGLVVLVGALVVGGLLPKKVESDQAGAPKTVIVGNTPLPVTDVFTRNIYQETLSDQILSGENFGVVTFSTVPPEQILVIETVSIQIDIPIGQKAAAGQLFGDVSATTAHFFPTFEVGSPNSGEARFAGLQNLRLYADPGASPSISSFRDSGTGSGRMTATISGYLIPDTSPSLSP